MKEQDQIIQKKLMIPKKSKISVKREALYHIFDEEKETVFFLTGRPGSGKTNVVADYCRMGKEKAKVLWYSFDKSDNEECNFLKCFVSGVANLTLQGREQFGKGVADGSKITKDVVHDLVGAVLGMVEAVKKEKRECYLVFDNFHHIINRNIINFMKLLLECVPEQAKVFILASSKIPPYFFKYLLEGKCRMVTEKELCFSSEEIACWTEQFFEKKAKKEQIEQIKELTEGWAAAIFWLLWLLKERSSEFFCVMEMTQEELLMNTMLYDYMDYEIYEKYSTKQQEFLLRTAVLHQLDSTLCNTCLGREDSSQMIHFFEKENLISVLPDKERQSYHYFTLFRLFLLEKREKWHQKEVKQQAFLFYLRKQEYDKAFLYAKENIEQISMLLERCGRKMLQENQLNLLGQCFSLLKENGQEFSVLELEIAAEYFYRMGNLEQMEQYLNCADSMFGKENKYGVYRSLYRGLFHYEENTEKYEKQINNALFFLTENHIAVPYLLEREQKILDKIVAEKENELSEKEAKKIAVSSFGTFCVKILEDGKELSWRTKKGCELFAYLVDRDGEAVERKTLLSELWREELPNNAIAMLHNMFYNIRKELSYYNLDYIISYQNKKYSMDVSVIQSDLSKVKMAAHYVETKNIEKLKEEKQMFLKYQGRYLEDIDSEWVWGKQEYYERIFEKGCCMLAMELMKQTEYEEALLYLKNALSVSVYSEKIVSMILICYGEIGDLKGAKKQYEEFCMLLKKELDLTPGEELKKSYQACMNR